MRFTPVGNSFGDMKITFTAVPAKTAGQGFSSARAQYMDVFIKFDTKTLTGFAVRLIRTTKYGDAIDFILMKYENGTATPISAPESASCYRPDCFISVEVKNNKLTVDANTNAEYYIIPNQGKRCCRKCIWNLILIKTILAGLVFNIRVRLQEAPR